MAVKTMNGKFVIKSAQFPNYALNVYSNNGVTSGMNVCLFPYSSTDLLQHWAPQAQGKNVYKISTAYPYSDTIVLDRLRTSPVNNCDMFTSGASEANGALSADLRDQQIQFSVGSDGYYTIYLYNGGKKDLVLTCASAVDNLGVGSVTSDLNVKDNVYWAAKNSSLGKRQKWTIVPLDVTPDDTILPCAQAYMQHDPTWAYLTTNDDFSTLGCAVCVLTTCGAIIKSDNYLTPAVCRDDGGFVYGNVSANWPTYGISTTPTYVNDLDGACEQIINQIILGNPVVVKVRNRLTDHFVTAYGYRPKGPVGRIVPEQILVIDPAYPQFSDLQQVLDSCAGGAGYQYLLLVED